MTSARDVEEWRQYLAGYSADLLQVAADGDLGEVSAAQRAAGWLGFDGADVARLAQTERRLGISLPPSYRSFLAASDGWLNLGPFMWTMRTTDDVAWLRDADPRLHEAIRDSPESGESALGDRALLVSGAGDAQYWLLDPGDAGPDGEWAAWTWASWYPGLGDRYESFAALVDAERASFEELSGRDGRPVDAAGAGALVDEGRALARRGDVTGAADALARAAVKGSGAGAYLAVMLNGFLDPASVHHEIRNEVLARPHVVEEIGREQLRAEAVPLYLRNAAIGPHRALFAGILTEDELAAPERFVPPVLPEPPAFQAALERARALADDGALDAAWAVVLAALPGWRSDSPHRIAPVVLLTDPRLRPVVTPERARAVVQVR
ncbi:SMI1/KNR4 family protein [Dactylosporangium sp. NPDC049140]|uniref:SMI1/KNR4 family protein n=1 Tax=Dactylosporangium sp. NPDC049140 TaxID=3155647 RepID=UPI0033D2EDB0